MDHKREDRTSAPKSKGQQDVDAISDNYKTGERTCGIQKTYQEDVKHNTFPV